MGYSPIRTQLMSVPPYAATFVMSVAIAFLGDRWGQRGYGLFFSGILAMVGYITSTTTSVLYGSIFLQTMGAFTCASAVGTWNINDVQRHYKRSPAVGLGLVWPNLRAFSQRGYSMIHRGSGMRQRSIWRSALEYVCLLLSTESSWWHRTGGRRGSGSSGNPQGVKKEKRRKGDTLELVTWTLSTHSDRTCTAYRVSTCFVIAST